jgi:hypothetical protein
MDIVCGFRRPPATWSSFIHEAFICMHVESIRLDDLMVDQTRDRPESR